MILSKSWHLKDRVFLLVVGRTRDIGSCLEGDWRVELAWQQYEFHGNVLLPCFGAAAIMQLCRSTGFLIPRLDARKTQPCDFARVQLDGGLEGIFEVLRNAFTGGIYVRRARRSPIWLEANKWYSRKSPIA